MRRETSTRYARSGDGVHVAYQVSGSGEHDLLLVPDGVIPIESMTELPAFDRFLRRLEGFARVIRFDRRGIGLSDPVAPSSPPTLERWMEDAVAVLEVAGSDRAALLGMAEGGFVTTLLAASRPERVASLVLVNATPGIGAEPFRDWGTAAGAIDRLGTTVEEEWGEIEFGIPLFAPSAVDDDRFAEWLTRAQRRALSPAIAQAVFDVQYRSDIRDVLPAVRVPTLVIHRGGSRYLDRRHGRYLAEHIEDARYVEVDGDDHIPYLGDSGPILDAVEEFVTGGRRPHETDRILITVLFTDVVGSTEVAARLGDARWRELLEEHHALARAEVERFGGREIDTAGDGLFAAFEGPGRAVRCAQEIVASNRRLGLSIRAGVHTGECERIGEKLAGIAVHVGARITATARPDEVLVSRTVKDLVAGSGIGFEDRGAHALKGVPEEWHLFAVSSLPKDG
jgi:class 3 adenylate cyclase